jgi:GTP cyclohydrolase II
MVAVSDAQAAADILAVERAGAELRRGLAVAITAPDVGALALAAEFATPATLSRLAGMAEGPLALVLTDKRALALNIRPNAGSTVRLPLTPWMDADTLRSLADPTGDLAHPFRGPFPRELAAPPAPDAAAPLLCKHAQLLPAAIVGPIEPGAAVAQRENLMRVSAAQVNGYSRATATTLSQVAAARVPLAGAEDNRIVAFRPANGSIEHLAIVIGNPPLDRPVLTRLHSECFTGDLLESLRCDCGQQLRGAVELIARSGGGILLYLAQEGRGIGLINKLRAYNLQDQGFDTLDANTQLGFDADERVFEPAAAMLRLLGYGAVRLLTNNPQKVAGLERCGIQVAERVPHAFPPSEHNRLYLDTKAKRAGHLF